MRESYIIDKNYNNSRFDKWFKTKILNIPQSLIEKILRKKKIKVNKKKIKTSYRLQIGDVGDIFNIEGYKPKNIKKTSKYKSSKKERKIYDDFVIENNENFLVINKPSGIAVQSGTKTHKNIIDILSSSKYFEGKKPYIVHRLDKETSGVFIIAKNREYAQLFTTLFRIRKIHKTYHAVAHGALNSKIKKLEDNLVYYDNQKKIIQKAITNLKIIKKNTDFSFLELNPITGRKHQIRKQLYAINHPIVFDQKYYLERNKKEKNNLLLHAYKIKFMINDIKYNFKASYSKNFSQFLRNNF